MNSYQRDVLSKRLEKDQKMVGAYMNELTAKRNHRTHSVETAMKLIAMSNGNVEATPENLTKYAETIYGYVTKDGSLSDLAEESNIKLP